MTDVLWLALAPVLRDLQSTGGPVPRIDETDWVGDPATASAMLASADGSAMGVSVRAEETSAEQIAWVAEQVQEWAWEQLWSEGRPTNWPVCPRHPDSHPMRATVVVADAAWICPNDHCFVVSIGALEVQV